MAKINSPRIIPFLWFDRNVEEAVKFYTSVFHNSKIIQLHPMVSTFELDGQRFMALNGGPAFKFTEAVSFYVNCDNQSEVDYYWDKLLSGGGKADKCGWLKDKYGLSWQIVPTLLAKLMSDKNPQKSKNVMNAVMNMVKLDVKTLQEAYDKP